MSMPRQRGLARGEQGTDALSDAFQQVTQGLVRVQEVLRLQERQVAQRLHDDSRRHEQRATAALREAMGSVEQRLQEKDEAYRVLAQRMEARARKVEEWITVVEQRLIPLVGLKGTEECGRAVELGELELRMRNLEASVQRALVSVFPRVEALVAQLEKSNSGVASVPTPASSSPSTSVNSDATCLSSNFSSLIPSSTFLGRMSTSSLGSMSPARISTSNISMSDSTFASRLIMSNSRFTNSSGSPFGPNTTFDPNAACDAFVPIGANATSGARATSGAKATSGPSTTSRTNATSGANATSGTSATFDLNETSGSNATSNANTTSGANATSDSSSYHPGHSYTTVLRAKTTVRPAPNAPKKSTGARQTPMTEREQAQKQRVELRMREVKIRRDNARAAPSSMGETLCSAVNIGKLSDIKRLLDSAADVNYIDTRGDSPLMLALLCTTPQEDVVDLLLQRGAEVNAVDACGQTAMHFAAALDRKWQFVSLLIGAGGDVNARNAFGATPLHWAAHRNNEAAVRLLLAAGASKSLKCWSDKWSDKTPFDVAEYEVLRQLLRP